MVNNDVKDKITNLIDSIQNLENVSVDDIYELIISLNDRREPDE